MSSHHSQRFFNLHHQQVASSRKRRQFRLLARIESFREERNLIRAEVRIDYLCGLFFSVVLFLFLAASSVVYLDYIIGK